MNEVLLGRDLARGLALLVLAEIQCGNEAGVHIAHEPMKAFETVPPTSWFNRIAALLRGNLDAPHLHHFSQHDALWKSLTMIAAHTKRLDLPAMLEVIRLLTVPADQSVVPADAALETLRHDADKTG